MMLGEKLGEASGALVGSRVLSVEEGTFKLELSMRGSGTVLGVTFADMITYTLVARPDGTYRGDGESVWLTEDGEASTGKDLASESPRAQVYHRALQWLGLPQTASAKLARPNGVTTVV